MDFVSHGLIGYTIGGWVGLILQLVPDISISVVKIQDIVKRKATLKEIFLDHNRKDKDEQSSLFLFIGRVFHSSYIPIILILFSKKLCLIYITHLVIDILTHIEQRPFFPFWNVKVKGLMEWANLSWRKYLIWIPLLVIALY